MALRGPLSKTARNRRECIMGILLARDGLTQEQIQSAVRKIPEWKRLPSDVRHDLCRLERDGRIARRRPPKGSIRWFRVDSATGTNA